MASADFVISLDTFSVGLPTVLVGKLFKKKVIIRTGGDFLWEGYVERTGKKVLLRHFYENERVNLNRKERTIFALTKWTLNYSALVVFSTEWQREIWREPYQLDLNRTSIIENYYGPVEPTAFEGKKKIFVGFTRALKWKNIDTLKRAFTVARGKTKDIILDVEPTTYEVGQEKIKSCYGVILLSLGDISPNLILDAIRFGKPFIVTEENGLLPRIGQLGITVDPLNEQAIAQKIDMLIDPTIYGTYRQRLVQFTFTHSWEEIAKEFLTCYRTIL